MPALRDRARRFLEWQGSTWVVLLATLLLALPSIGLGFYNDDFALRASVKGTWPSGPPFWDLYRFVPGTLEGNRLAIESGALPWWSAPELRLHLVRPLTSLLFTLDDRLWGAAPLGYHLHSIAWYLALVAVVGVVLRSVLPRATAQLAMLVFALSAAHLFPYAWISCRHMVLAALPALLGFAAFVRDRSPTRQKGSWLLALGLAVGLGAGEAALGVVGFVLAFAVGRSAPPATTIGDRLRTRLPQMAPALTVTALYLLVYSSVGGGAAGSDGYVDPFSAPGRFAAKTATMLPVLMANAFAGMPAELATFAPKAPLVIAGVVVTTLIALFARKTAPSMSLDERSALPWLVVGGVLALLPSLGGFPGARVLLVPNLGFAALLAILIRRGLGARGIGARVAAGLLVFVHLLAAPLASLGNGSFNAGAARQLERIAGEAELGDARPRVFVLGTSDPTITIYVPSVLAANNPDRLSCWSMLSTAKLSHRLTRTSASELHLRTVGGSMLRGPFETLYRAQGIPLRIGDEAHQCGAAFRVTEVEEGRPVEVAIAFDRPLDDPSIRFLAWRDGKLRQLPPPPPGESLDVAWSPGPLGMF